MTESNRVEIRVPWLHGPVHDWLVIPAWLHARLHNEGVDHEHRKRTAAS